MDDRNFDKKSSAQWYYIILAAIVIVPILISLVTKLWVFTAIAIGCLFGFFLQKGDLCGASAFSEVLLLKSWRKVFGLWVAIAVSMIGFAGSSALGWIVLSPKPFIWLNYIVGGIIFGIGMVLAGGCVSGCLYKAGSGNLNSMAGLVGIPIGVAMVESGPLAPLQKYLLQFIVKAEDGSPITLSTLTGLPYWTLAIGFGIVTLIIAFLFSKQKSVSTTDKSMEEKIFFQSWKPWVAGIAIGLLAIPAYLSSAATGRNYPLGVTHGVFHAELLLMERQLDHVYQKNAPNPNSAANAQTSAPADTQPKKKIVWWLVALIVSMVAGSFLSGKLSGQTRLLPKPPEQTAIAFIGGILVGTGAAIATGCVIGNILSGWALMSVGNFLFGIVTILANWVTTYFYLMGASLFRTNA